MVGEPGNPPDALAAPSDALAARALALDVLLRVEDGGAYADVALANALGASALAIRDRAFASRLVYGTLAWRRRLDCQLAHLTNRDPSTLESRVLAILRLGLHQITLLDRVPDHAAVATSVDLAKRQVPAASGLVNAVLRRAAREKRTLESVFPGRDVDPIDHLAVAASHPTWLVERWVRRFGLDATRELLAADNDAAPTVVRARPGKREALLARFAAAGIAAEPGCFAPDAIRVNAGDPHGLADWSTGGFSVQEEASQLVVDLLDPRPGMRVLDACAAPGGKTAYAAERMAGSGLVVALDQRRRGARAIVRNAARLGLGNVAAVALDARRADAAFAGTLFDRVLVDAPCSGLGTLRAHPEIRWRRTPEDLDRLAAQQASILEAASSLVAAGGVLVYSTCTLTDEENEGVVGPWLASHPEFEREGARGYLPESARALVDDAGALCTLPHRDGLDGFFAVRARRR